MSRLTATDAQCEALFASRLQRSDAPAASVVAAEISRIIRELGVGGCACRVAQEFGDHPDAARERMRWAREVLASVAADSGAPGDAPECAA